MTTKATIYLDAKLHRAAKVKAAQTNNTLSAVMSDALRESLREDAIDLAAIPALLHPIGYLPETQQGLLKDLRSPVQIQIAKSRRQPVAPLEHLPIHP